jgi:pimeloyl-ACP methyl ester carboxylesterase
MGGYVSLSFAKNYPDYLKGLVLMNSHPFADTAEKKQNRMQEIDLINIGKKSLLLSNFIQKLYAPDFNDQEKIEKSRTMAELTCPKGMIACLKAMANRTDCSEVIHNAKYPILWIYGKKDQLFNYELADNFITQNNRLIKLKLDNVGHMSMFEAKDEVTKALKQFIDLCL